MWRRHLCARIHTHTHTLTPPPSPVPTAPPALPPAVDSIDADLFGSSIRGGGFQPSDESRHRCAEAAGAPPTMRGMSPRASWAPDGTAATRQPFINATACALASPSFCTPPLLACGAWCMLGGAPHLRAQPPLERARALAAPAPDGMSPAPRTSGPAPARSMRTAVHRIIVDAYNSNLHDLEAHRDALAAAAARIKAQEMLTGKAPRQEGGRGGVRGADCGGGHAAQRGARPPGWQAALCWWRPRGGP